MARDGGRHQTVFGTRQNSIPTSAATPKTLGQVIPALSRRAPGLAHFPSQASDHASAMYSMSLRAPQVRRRSKYESSSLIRYDRIEPAMASAIQRSGSSFLAHEYVNEEWPRWLVSTLKITRRSRSFWSARRASMINSATPSSRS